jgi:O-glycosyl hydrolase
MGANVIDAFANSPPWWMTISGSVTGAPHGTNNLQPAAETDFAAYLATVVSNLTALDGIHFNFVTPINEPTGGWSYNSKKQEGCHMTPDQQVRMIAALSQELKKSASTSVIDGPEDYSEQDSVDDLNNYSRTALDSLALVSTHTYKADNPSGLQRAAASLGKPLWVAEYGDGDATGLTMAKRIHDDITGLRARAWVYWQVVDNGYGWGFLYNPLASPSSWRFTEKYEIYEKFYVMEQYTKFIRPGCNILSVNDANTLAAYDPMSTLTLVVFNKNSTNFNVTYHLTGFNRRALDVQNRRYFRTPFSEARIYRTSSTEKFESSDLTPIPNDTITAEIPAKTVVTFVLTRNYGSF